MNRSLWIMVASVGVLAGLFWLTPNGQPPAPMTTATDPSGNPLKPAIVELNVFCAASNRAVLEKIRQDYEAEYHVPVSVQYGPSETLLSSMTVTGTGDLYLPADVSYLNLAREKRLVAEVLPLARMQAVLAIPKSATPPASLDELIKSDRKLVQANPDAAAIGKLTRAALQQSGEWDAVAKKTVAYKTTVNEVTNDVQVGAADAGIVWDAVLTTYPMLQGVAVPELAGVTADVSLGVIATTKQPQRALHFARYVAAADRGLKRYAELGFHTVEGDPWADRPEIMLYAGSMLRPAIEQTLVEFEAREGVAVNRKYNGCGILVAQMKAGEIPDAYFACDSEFMNQVHDLFPSPADISQNQLVIIVPKGNPQGIRSLKDLTNPGLRVGIGHEKQCAMGWLTQRTLVEGKLQEEVMANVVVQTPSGDMLVNQMKAGSLDAAVAYISNAAGSADTLDAIRITGLQCAIATQPFAVAQNTSHKQLTARLLDRLQQAESRAAFEQNGFLWKAITGQ